MLKGQNRKVNSIGKIGCAGALALGIALLNPLIGASVYAEEIEDYGVDAQAMSSSIVGISFSPASGSTSLTPITSAGQSAQINVKAKVNVANSGGYAVYLRSNTQNLVGVNNPNNVIPGIAGSATYDNLSTNTWGYASAEGVAVPEGARYKAISVSGQGDKIAENANSKIISDTKEIMLSFVAKIGDNMPADTYKSTVTMSVVSSPVQLALGDISDMQQMTSEICENTTLNASKQLRDVRDGKYYWVSKLADGKCWMTQNLDLDLSTSTKLTSDTSDVPVAGWTPGHTTANSATASTVETGWLGQRSWSLGNYRITNPNSVSNCGTAKNSASDCPSQLTAYNTPMAANGDMNAHYILGNHYQWNAATAGTGGTILAGRASGSICPKGWRLPTSDAGGEFETLLAKLGGTTSTNNVTQAPFYGARGGNVSQLPEHLFEYAGAGGGYWSATPISTGLTYALNFYGTDYVNPSWTDGYRELGYSVRCVAR